MQGCSCQGLFRATTGVFTAFVPPEGPARLSITDSVGANGSNRPADVRIVQSALNRVPANVGGPRAALSVDGIAGPLTKGAIRGFQQKWLTGRAVDSRIDPAGATIAKLKEILAPGGRDMPIRGASDGLGAFDTPEITEAKASMDDARKRIRDCLARLQRIKPLYANFQTSATTGNAEQRHFEWHFRGHLMIQPALYVDHIASIYTKMLKCLDGDRPNLVPGMPLFAMGLPTKTYVAFAPFNGYAASPTDLSTHDGKEEVPVSAIYIYVHPGAHVTGQILVHELAHFCGPGLDSKDLITHTCNPSPWPWGKAEERSLRNYRHMLPQDALRNAWSFQLYAMPEDPASQVPDGFASFLFFGNQRR